MKVLISAAFSLAMGLFIPDLGQSQGAYVGFGGGAGAAVNIGAAMALSPAMVGAGWNDFGLQSHNVFMQGCYPLGQPAVPFFKNQFNCTPLPANGNAFLGLGNFFWRHLERG